jgi:amphi-Trp domain-containing protein
MVYPARPPSRTVTDDYEMELTTNREEVATLLAGLADGVGAGAVRLGPDGDDQTVQLSDELDLELAFEADDDEQGIEVQLEWSTDGLDDAGETAPSEEGESTGDEQEPPGQERGSADDEPAPPAEETVEPAVGAAARQVSLGRFELFEDRGGEWRWRLVHRNGNVVATSGEGYTRKHNARKGLRSVMRSAPGAAVTERE